MPSVNPSRKPPVALGSGAGVLGVGDVFFPRRRGGGVVGGLDEVLRLLVPVDVELRSRGVEEGEAGAVGRRLGEQLRNARTHAREPAPLNIAVGVTLGRLGARTFARTW